MRERAGRWRGARRPQAAALVALLADPGRGWDAVVIGEYERAFYGSQYALMAPLLEHYGVQLWMPEAGGRVGYASEHDEKTMTVLGLSSKREITRTSIRVRAAMAVQTREQGRYLGDPLCVRGGWYRYDPGALASAAAGDVCPIDDARRRYPGRSIAVGEVWLPAGSPNSGRHCVSPVIVTGARSVASHRSRVRRRRRVVVTWPCAASRSMPSGW